MHYALFEKHVLGTVYHAIVFVADVVLCHTPLTIDEELGIHGKKVSISTRVLKHTYDKRPAEQFDFLMSNLTLIITEPDKIYKNKDGKRGEYSFRKDIDGHACICIIEISEKGNEPHLEVVTFFRPEERYFRKYELLWEWKDGNPSS